MLTIYTITFNEEILIQYMINYYRIRFPKCHIVIYDNNSTDQTVYIAKYNKCEIRTYNSNNTLNDKLHMQIKNTCWKDAQTDWVLVCDLDELLDINEEQLKNEEVLGNTKIKTEGWSMINMEDNFNIDCIKYGVRENQYDKDILFNRKYISESNYEIGGHQSKSVGYIQYSKPYRLYHYKYININTDIVKSKLTAQRLSEDNRQNGWGTYCLRSEEELRNFWQELRNKAIKIL